MAEPAVESRGIHNVNELLILPRESADEQGKATNIKSSLLPEFCTAQTRLAGSECDCTSADSI